MSRWPAEHSFCSLRCLEWVEVFKLRAFDHLGRKTCRYILESPIYFHDMGCNSTLSLFSEGPIREIPPGQDLVFISLASRIWKIDAGMHFYNQSGNDKKYTGLRGRR